MRLHVKNGPALALMSALVRPLLPTLFVKCEPKLLSGDLAGVCGDLAGLRGDLAGVRGDLAGVRGDIVGASGAANDDE